MLAFKHPLTNRGGGLPPIRLPTPRWRSHSLGSGPIAVGEERGSGRLPEVRTCGVDRHSPWSDIAPWGDEGGPWARRLGPGGVLVLDKHEALPEGCRALVASEPKHGVYRRADESEVRARTA